MIQTEAKTNMNDVSMFVVMKDAGLVSADEFDGYGKDDVSFILLTNDTLNNEYGDDHSIFISRNWCDQPVISDLIENLPNGCYNEYHTDWTTVYTIHWSFDFERLDNEPLHSSYNDLNHDFDGYGHSKSIMSSVPRLVNDFNVTTDHCKRMTPLRYIPALYGTYLTTRDFMGSTYHGYLPSAGQLGIIVYNIGRINSLLVLMDSQPLKYVREDTVYSFWTSNEGDADHQYSLDIGLGLLNKHKGKRSACLPCYNIRL